MEEVIVFVYKKKGKFVVNNGFQHNQLLESGYTHISTINTCVFMNNILNEQNVDTILQVIKEVKTRN